MTSSTSTVELPTEIILDICQDLHFQNSMISLSSLASTSRQLHSLTTPTLYQKLKITSSNYTSIFSGDLTTKKDLFKHTQSLHIKSIPTCTSPSINNPDLTLLPTSAPLFLNVKDIILGSKATWEFMLYKNKFKISHPFISFLSSQTSPSNLTIKFAKEERLDITRHSVLSCCAVRLDFPDPNPTSTAYDVSCTRQIIEDLTNHWNLESITLNGITNELLPERINTNEIIVQFDECQCGNENYCDDWCGNHVPPSKRIKQVLDISREAKKEGKRVEINGVEKVGWTDMDDVGGYIMRKVIEELEDQTPEKGDTEESNVRNRKFEKVNERSSGMEWEVPDF